MNKLYKITCERVRLGEWRWTATCGDSIYDFGSARTQEKARDEAKNAKEDALAVSKLV